MTDLPTSAYVSRPLLGGGDLNINDHTSYALAGPTIFTGQVQWERKTMNAPWVDGEITYQRRRTTTMEPLTIYCKGSSQADLDSKIGTLRDAFFQDYYVVMITVGGANHAWNCEAADITNVLYDTAHVHNKYVAVTFNIPRHPVQIAGGF